ncbi:hypothetical protein [Candidatus Nitrosotalea okcheonensis]|uniref:hypothetical protein n=1 Tax=Candidatus Nitrosotalea okcheonensis TaxID=1903276 RepID=UPI0012FFF437|nr:hypothetical protein [Candidatus Nitrosotalea okcheonensis]
MDEIGAWASIFGIILGIIAIALTIVIYRRTGNIQKKQLENAEGLYVVKTQDYLRKIQNHFDQIFKTIEKRKLDNDEDKQLITQELNLYFRKYHGDMIKLLQNSERSLELWVNLDHVVRDKFDKVISNFDWLITTFFPLNVDNDDMRTTIWTTEYNMFLEKKYDIDSILKKELKAEN